MREIDRQYMLTPLLWVQANSGMAKDPGISGEQKAGATPDAYDGP